MPRIVVNVMPKPEVLDPQGKALSARFEQLGFTQFSDARQGRRIELEVQGEVTEELKAQAKELASQVLANPSTEVIVGIEVAE